MKLKGTFFWNESQDKPKQHIKKQNYHFADKHPYIQSYGFSASHVQMWELGHKEGWALKYRCFWIVLEKTLQSRLDFKETKPVTSKWSLLWIVIGKAYVEAETPILWPLAKKSQTDWKRPWCWERLKTKEEGNRRWDG